MFGREVLSASFLPAYRAVNAAVSGTAANIEVALLRMGRPLEAFPSKTYAKYTDALCPLLNRL